MRAVVQRVSEAEVRVDQQPIGAIGRGLLVLLGIGEHDNLADVRYVADKIVHLRVFADPEEKMNLSVLDVQGALLVVSQFTLWGDCRKGRRPSFVSAASPGQARPLYEAFVKELRQYGLQVATGRFQEMMQVHLVNDGPVTLMLDSQKAF